MDGIMDQITSTPPSSPPTTRLPTGSSLEAMIAVEVNKPWVLLWDCPWLGVLFNWPRIIWFVVLLKKKDNDCFGHGWGLKNVLV